MINIQSLSADSVVITIQFIKEIKANRILDLDDIQEFYREVSFVDNSGRVVTIQMQTDEKENLEIKEGDRYHR